MVNENPARNFLKSRLLKIIIRINRGLADDKNKEITKFQLKTIRYDLILIIEQLNYDIHSLQKLKIENEGGDMNGI